MSEPTTINTTAQPTTNTMSGPILAVSSDSSGTTSTITTISGTSNPYPYYEKTSSDPNYNTECRSTFEFNNECKTTIFSNISFTISGNYTISGTTITASSSCIITIKFTGDVLNTSTETIAIPSGTVISGSGKPISSIKTLKDLSTSKLTMNIIVTIRNAFKVLNTNTINAEMQIEFKRNYNHLTSTTTTPSIAGYTNYAPGQFSTNLSPSLTGKISGTTSISGTSGTFNSAITFTSQPSFTHIVYPSV